MPDTDKQPAAVDVVAPATMPREKVLPKFGLIAFSRPNTETVSERFGRKSTPMINFNVELPRIGMKLDATIWARLQPLKDGSGDEIVPDTGLPKNVSALSADAKDAYTDYVNAAAMKWAGYDRAYDDAVNRLLGKTSKRDDKRVTLAPRVVKRVAAPAAARS